MVRVPAGGGAVQGCDDGSWRGRQRQRALAWEAAATGVGAGVGGGGGRWRGRRRRTLWEVAAHARGRRERAGLDWVSRGLQTPSQKDSTRALIEVKRSKTGYPFADT